MGRRLKYYALTDNGRAAFYDVDGNFLSSVEVGALRMVVAGNGIKCPQTATFRGFSCDKSPLSFGFPLQFAGDTGDKLKN